MGAVGADQGEEGGQEGAALRRRALAGEGVDRLAIRDLAAEIEWAKARLVRADLRGASFSGARLSYAVLDHADGDVGDIDPDPLAPQLLRRVDRRAPPRLLRIGVGVVGR